MPSIKFTSPSQGKGIHNCNANTYFNKRRSVNKDLDIVVKMANKSIYNANHHGMPSVTQVFWVTFHNYIKQLLVLQSNSCTIHTLKHIHFNI
jgi:hypothetical protein